MSNYHIIYTNNQTVLPKKELVNAVFLIAFDNSKILAIKNERGWDIPGGHIEGEETLEEGLAREVQEEAGATFSDAKLFATSGSNNQDRHDKVMFFYTTNNFSLGNFIATEDALGREVIEVKEFLEKCDNPTELADLISHAQLIVANQQDCSPNILHNGTPF